MWKQSFMVSAAALIVLRSVEGEQTGMADGEAIQRRIDALGEKGGFVKLSAQTYLLTRSLRLPNNVTLKGAGRDKTVLRLSGGVNAPAIITQKPDENKNPEGTHDVALLDLTVDANGESNPKLVTGGICLPNCYNYRIERIKVINARGFAGIYTNPNHEAARKKIAYRNFIVNCIVEGTLPKLFGPEDPDKNPYGHGIYVTAWDNENVLVRGNVCRKNHGAGIFLEDKVEYITVEHNLCEDNGGCGIWVNETRNSIVRFNRIRNSGGRGIAIDGEFSGFNLIYGNEIENSGWEGILVASPGRTQHPHHCAVVDNWVMNSNLGGYHEVGGIYIVGENNWIAHNVSINSGSEGKQWYGISVMAPHNTLVRNYLRPNQRAEVGWMEQVQHQCTFVPYDYEKGWAPQDRVASPLPEDRSKGAATQGSGEPEAQPSGSGKGQARRPADGGEIQKQINALDEAGGVVQLEAGTYVLKRGIVLRDGVTVQGAGIGKTVLRLGNGVNQPVFVNEKRDENKQPEGNHDITIKDLTIDGNASNNPLHGEGVLLPNCYNYRLENLHVRNCRGYAGLYTNPNHAASRRKERYRNYLVNCLVEGTEVATDYDAPYGHGIYVTAWDNDNVLLRGCVTRYNKGSGLHLEDGVEQDWVEKCESYGNRQYGLWMCGVRNSTVRLNRIHHNLRGIQMDYGSGYNVLYGNEVNENGLEGILLGTYGFDDSKFLPNAQGFNVLVGNTVRSNNRLYMDAGSGLFVKLRRNFIGFNFCYDDSKDKRQFLGLIVHAPENVILANYLRPHAYRTGELCQSVEGNELIPFNYEKPWTPWNWVGAGER